VFFLGVLMASSGASEPDVCLIDSRMELRELFVDLEPRTVPMDCFCVTEEGLGNFRVPKPLFSKDPSPPETGLFGELNPPGPSPFGGFSIFDLAGNGSREDGLPETGAAFETPSNKELPHVPKPLDFFWVKAGTFF